MGYTLQIYNGSNFEKKWGIIRKQNKLYNWEKYSTV